MSFDVAVIGSGVGGLVAAVALARKGLRPIVFEQHYLPGGWTHSFTMGGHRFSPGVHYIGGLGQGGDVRRIYEGLGLSRDLEMCEMNPDGFDHFLIDGERVDQPKGLDRWLARLFARFPHEREGIERYFATVLRLTEDIAKVDRYLSFPAVLTVPFRAPSLLRWGLRTAEDLIDTCVKDPLLKAVLSAQCGNHGLAPARVSLPAHAVMTAHYLDGGYYPRGGAKRIAQALIKELRRRGGAIKTRARVTRILEEGGRAIGVELESGEAFFTEHVVCNADPAVTYGKLLPRELCARELAKIRKTEWSVSLISVFLAVDMRLRTLGFDSGNYWWYRTPDVNGLYARLEKDATVGRCDGLFLSISSLKDPGERPNGHHTIELFTFAPYAMFEGLGEPGDRSEEYERRKRRMADALLESAENVIPNLRRHITFMAVGTPLTNDFYVETYRGAAYGTAKTPWQLGPFSFDQRGPLERLWMCGASTLSHGVAGASLSGLIAAKSALGLASIDELLEPADGSLRVYPADRPERWPTRPRVLRPVMIEDPRLSR